MTIRMLCDHGPYKAGNIVNLDAATETSLVAQHVADTTLTGGLQGDMEAIWKASGAANLKTNRSMATPRAPSVVVELGDSMSSQSVQVNSSTDKRLTAAGIMVTAAAINGGLYEVIVSGNGSGERIDEWIKRYDAEVLPYNPDWVAIPGGSNDRDQDLLAAVSFPNLLRLVLRCIRDGAQVLYLGLTCFNFGNEFRHTQAYLMHALCKRLHRKRIGFFYQPMHNLGVDWTTTTGAEHAPPLANLTWDGIRHATGYGTHTVYAQVPARFFAPLLAGARVGAGAARWAGNVGDIESDYIRNGIFGGAGVAASGTHISGTDPTDWTTVASSSSAITCVCSLTPINVDAPGQYATHTITNSGGPTETISLVSGNSANATFIAPEAGTPVAVEMSVDASTTSGTIAQLCFRVTCKAADGATILLTTAWNELRAATEYLNLTSFKGRGRVQFVVPAGTDRIQVTTIEATSAAGQAVIKWFDCDCYPVDTTV